METLVTYSVDPTLPLWQTFAKADRVVNKLGANGIEGCRFALDKQVLTVLVPVDLLDAAVQIMTTGKYTR